MTLSAYEEYCEIFKETQSLAARNAVGKGALRYEELAAGFKEAAALSTADEFRQMVASLVKGNLWGYSIGKDQHDRMYSLTLEALLEGGIQPSTDKNFEKLHLVMTEFRPLFGNPAPHLAKALVLSDDPADILSRAGLDGLPSMSESVRDEFLNPVLLCVLQHGHFKNALSALEATLIAGADANQSPGGDFHGYPLLLAAQMELPVSMVKLLCEHGANFEDTYAMLRFRLHVEGRSQAKDDIAKLRYYEGEVTGKPVEPDQAEKIESLEEQIQKMKQEMLTLRRKVTRLSRKPATGPKGRRSGSYSMLRISGKINRS